MVNTTIQTGKTTDLMLGSPVNSYYVWCNNDLSYPTFLASKLGRRDLKIVGPGFIREERLRGLHLTNIILDHAIEISDKQWDVLDHMAYVDDCMLENFISKTTEYRGE